MRCRPPLSFHYERKCIPWAQRHIGVSRFRVGTTARARIESNDELNDIEKISPVARTGCVYQSIRQQRRATDKMKWSLRGKMSQKRNPCARNTQRSHVEKCKIRKIQSTFEVFHCAITEKNEFTKHGWYARSSKDLSDVHEQDTHQQYQALAVSPRELLQLGCSHLHTAVYGETTRLGIN